MHHAVLSGNFSLVQLLVTDYKVKIKQKDTSGKTAIERYCSDQDFPLIREAVKDALDQLGKRDLAEKYGLMV